MPKQTQKITPGDAFTPEESRTSSKLLLGYGRVSNVRTSSSNTTTGGGGGGGGGGAGGSGNGGSGTVITISTAKGEDWKMHYPVHEPCLSFGSRVRVFGKVVNGWVSGGRVEITVDEEGGVEKEEEEVRIKEVIPLKAYSEVVGINTPHPTGTTTTTTTPAVSAAATTMGILVCIKFVFIPFPPTPLRSHTNILTIHIANPPSNNHNNRNSNPLPTHTNPRRNSRRHTNPLGPHRDRSHLRRLDRLQHSALHHSSEGGHLQRQRANKPNSIFHPLRTANIILLLLLPDGDYYQSTPALAKDIPTYPAAVTTPGVASSGRKATIHASGILSTREFEAESKKEADLGSGSGSESDCFGVFIIDTGRCGLGITV